MAAKVSVKARDKSGALRGPQILVKMIRESLEKNKMGVNTDYLAVIGHLTVSQMKPVVMKKWLEALKLCVSQLNKDADMLVGATLRLSWYDQEADIVDLYIDYLSNLISAQTFYLNSALVVLVKQLWLPSNGACVFYNIHKALEAVFQLVPTAPSVIMPVLSKNYPFKGKGADVQELALRNVLYMTSYCPVLRDGILELIMHQMLSIDVEIPRLDELEVIADDTQFDVEVEDVSSCHGNESELRLVPVYSSQCVMKNESAEKLDVMMKIMFEYMDSLVFKDGVLLVDSASNLLKAILKIFSLVVLPTHSCSHVQFIVYRLTSLHDSFSSLFLDLLWEKFQDVNTPSVLRQTCAAYIASYIARSKFVPLTTARLCLTIMMKWIHQYMDGCSPASMKPDVRLHSAFSSLCQAVFYVFVFRHKAILETPDGLKFSRQLNFERVISSRLNPLKVCLSSIVELFASVTNHYEIAFCYSIMEQNKRLILSSVGNSVTPDKKSQDQINLLDCYFPFDPYYLKRSAEYLQSLYQEWEELDFVENDDCSSVSSSLANSCSAAHSLDAQYSMST